MPKIDFDFCQEEALVTQEEKIQQDLSMRVFPDPIQGLKDAMLKEPNFRDGDRMSELAYLILYDCHVSPSYLNHLQHDVGFPLLCPF